MCTFLFKDILANITLAEASGLDTKGDDISSDPEPENEREEHEKQPSSLRIWVRESRVRYSVRVQGCAVLCVYSHYLALVTG